MEYGSVWLIRYDKKAHWNFSFPFIELEGILYYFVMLIFHLLFACFLSRFFLVGDKVANHFPIFSVFMFYANYPNS